MICWYFPGIYQRTFADLSSQKINQPCAAPCGLNHPFDHNRPGHFDAQAVKYLLLAIQRQPVSKLGYGNV